MPVLGQSALFCFNFTHLASFTTFRGRVAPREVDQNQMQSNQRSMQ